jgi:hypothetical protein
MLYLQVVTNNFACLIEVDEYGYIRKAAPLLKIFEQQYIRNLIHWLQNSFIEAKIIDLSDQRVLYEKFL